MTYERYILVLVLEATEATVGWELDYSIWRRENRSVQNNIGISYVLLSAWLCYTQMYLKQV